MQYISGQFHQQPSFIIFVYQGCSPALTALKQQVGVEIPMDSDEADEENKSEGGKTLLYVFERG